MASNPPPNQDDNALDALQNLANSQGRSPVREDSVDASGFVGMLAKGMPAEPDPGPAPKISPMAQNRPMPAPKPRPVAPAAGATVNPTAGPIPMAREIRPAAPSAPAGPPQEAGGSIAGENVAMSPAAPIAPASGSAVPSTPVTASAMPASAPAALPYRARVRRPAPSWYRTAIPVAYTLSSLLFFVGIWAAMATISVLTESDIAPMFDRNDNTGKVLALILLACLPVALALSVMAVIMGRQVARSTPRS